MLFPRLREDIDAIMTHDPAARSRVEVLLCYPGLHAVIFHRWAYAAWNARLRLIGRLLSYAARLLTGIEIHPAAQVGRRLFIDHGFGVVIGQTAEIGDDVTLYQGVTLGGISLAKEKRHPTLGNGVIVGAGAKILGPLMIGDGARVGSNAVVLKDVPAGATVVGIPAKQVGAAKPTKAPEFSAYAQAPNLPDPVARALNSLSGDVSALRARVAELEALSVAQRDQLEPAGPTASEVFAATPMSRRENVRENIRTGGALG